MSALPWQGIKLESFIFDPLFLASKLVLMEVKRDAHFAPVKNANGAKNDTPDTARQAVLALHRRWARLAPPLSDSVCWLDSFSCAGAKSINLGNTYQSKTCICVSGISVSETIKSCNDRGLVTRFFETQ